jgi:hypothetical protein
VSFQPNTVATTTATAAVPVSVNVSVGTPERYTVAIGEHTATLLAHTRGMRMRLL